ncbi:MAG: dethiobiotin synthase [Candidatus Mariimomonas ferrooxydans]
MVEVVWRVWAIGLLKALKEKGLNVCPMKPVETGCRGIVPLDAVRLIRASGAGEPLDIINPYRFRLPLAPAVAAETEKVSIKKKKILSACNYLLKKYDITIIEGAGGIMAPVYKKYLFLDLITDMGIPIIIVSRPGLGTINHTLLTIETAKGRGIEILGVIINYAAKTKKGLPERTNPEVIEKLGGVPILGIVLYSKNTNSSSIKKEFHKITEKILKRI